MADMLQFLKSKRTIRRFTDKSVPHADLEKIAEAGLYAPNAGGGQSTKIIMVEDFETIEKIGIRSADCENRDWGGKKVNAEQPSIIDDLSIKNGFYGCRALAIVCTPKERYTMTNSIGTGFVCLQNMALEAYSLGIDSCIVGRAEATFSAPDMQALLDAWGLGEDYKPLMFLCMGYIDGPYPKAKPRKEGRVIFAK